MEGAELKLYGSWASPFCLVVEMALKLKGIPYTYQEENIGEKSESLLRHNPIHKKIPVLLHNGRPIAESLVILEYIEETWKETPLLPSDPYERARFRFWIAFLYDKVLNSFLNLMFNSFIDYYRFSLTFLCFSFTPACRSIVATRGAEQEKAAREAKEHLRTFEEGAGKEFPTEERYFHGNAPGMLDIVMGSSACWRRVLAELTGIELVDEDCTPILCRRLKAFEEGKVAKETLPQHEKLMAYAKNIRNKILGSKAD